MWPTPRLGRSSSAATWPNRWSRSLSAVRTCRKLTAEVEDAIPVALMIENHGKLPIVWTLVEDILPPGAFHKHHGRMTVSGTTIRAMALQPGERKMLSYQVQFHRRGYYRIGPLLQETGDLLGFLPQVPNRDGAPLPFSSIRRSSRSVGWEVASPRPVGEVRLGCRLFEDPTRIAGVRLYERGRSDEPRPLEGDRAGPERFIPGCTTRPASRARRSCSISTRTPIRKNRSRTAVSWRLRRPPRWPMRCTKWDINSGC